MLEKRRILTAKETQGYATLMDTRTSSRRGLWYQKGTELRKIWQDSNHCFSTAMLFKLLQDHGSTNQEVVDKFGALLTMHAP